MNKVLVCQVGGTDVYGSEMERDAALLQEGDKVLFKGEPGIVDYTWYYEGVIVHLKDGRRIFPALGDVFEMEPPQAKDTKEL